MNVAFKEPNTSTRSLDAIAEALFLPSGIDGIYARTALFEMSSTASPRLSRATASPERKF